MGVGVTAIFQSQVMLSWLLILHTTCYCSCKLTSPLYHLPMHSRTLSPRSTTKERFSPSSLALLPSFPLLPSRCTNSCSLQWQLYPKSEAQVCKALSTDNPDLPMLQWGNPPPQDESTAAAVGGASKAYNFACQNKMQCSQTFSYAWFDLGILPCASLPWLYP